MNFYIKSLCRPRAGMAKILLVMRLIVILLTTAILQVSASSYGQNVTLKQSNAKLSSVLDQIRKQTGYDFFYSQAMMEKAKPVNINLSKVGIEKALEMCFEGQPLSYTIENKIVTVKEKEPGLLDRVIARFQSIDVRGRVVDSLGNGLAGATVSVKGGKGSTSTAANGDFYLKNVDEAAVLMVSYLGYLTRDVKINKEFMYVALHQSESRLDEIKVIAYGTTTPRLSTGSSQGIKAAEIEKQPVNNPLYALQGRIAGLQVMPTTGLAGGAVNLQIRGKNSLNYESKPLIVIDGLPVINNVVALGHSELSELSTLSFINPNDIESIDVLKDADATSIYGSRGANGVILITTKKGKIGKVQIDINAQNGISSVPMEMEMLNTGQYLELRMDGYANSGFDLANSTITASRADVKLWDQNRYTNWQKELIGGNGRFTDFQGFVSAGSPTVQYKLGGNYHSETTVFPGSNSDVKGNTHLSITGSSIDQRFKTNITASYTSDINTLPGQDFTRLAITLPPNAPGIYNQDGTLNWEYLPSGGSSWTNPLATLTSTYNAKVNNLIASAFVSYNALSTLNIKAHVGYNQLRGDAFRRTSPFEGRDPKAPYSPASSNFNMNEVNNISFEPQIDYSLHIGKGELKALVGASFQSTTTESQSTFAFGFTSDALLKNLASATDYFVNNTSSEYRYNAIFGRLGYNLNNKYLLNFNIRRDGSSRFGPGNQFGNYGSIGAAWVFSQEDFLKSSLSFLSFGKLRASYGSSGNDGIGDYQYLERYQPVENTDVYQGTKGFRSNGVFNSYFAWETTKKMEFGIETGFFDDRILLNVNYFRNRSDNQLINYPLPSIAGPGGAIYNLPAVIQNSGFEFVLSTENIKLGSFRWITSLTFTRNRNKLVAYPDIEGSSYYRSQIVGHPFAGVSRVYNYAGVDPATGQYQFKDFNGNLTFTPEESQDLNAGQYLTVMTDPKFYGGISNSLTFRKISFDFFFQFTKQMGINPLSSFIETAGGPGNLPVDFADRWKTSGMRSDIQKIYYYVLMPDDYKQAANRLMNSSFNYVDASFIRLKNLSVSYNIINNTPVAGIRKLKVYIQGQNLFTITNYKGLDPETQSISSLPPLRVVTAGIQLSL